MKTLFVTRPLPEAVIAALEARFKTTVRAENTPLSDDEMRAALAGYDAILPTLGDMFTAEILAAVAAPRCRILANFGVGYNHIDIAAATRADIAVTNTPGAVTDATADIAMTLMLMSARRAGEGERLVRAGQWQGWHPTQMLGLHLSGKTVGILGMGRIGQAIARRCHFGFGMAVKYASRSAKALDFDAERLADPKALAAAVDVLVAAVPGGGDTRHMVDAELLAAMRPHGHFINISRGEVVDEAALIAALRARRIAGAGLDVYEFEPEVPAALRALDNVVLLPHLGTAALEVRRDMGMMAVANLAAFDEGRPLPNQVN
ncbi:2-hydroxyacid dehydrogenase [Shimia sp.]|uniref:2-hydroxyacid dehydrogenase n=1 Tax=Shimia sp. TaxID=1954381 RepID=UPI0035647E81